MKRLAAVLLAVSLSACATYQGYGYRDDGYYDDRYYEGPDYYRGSPARDRYYYDDYGYPGYAGFGYGGYGYGGYPYYYTSLWPIYHGYYDPFYNPYFHYGVTYFPRSYFGFGYGGYGYPRYQPYAPYRYSWYDNYFGISWYHDRRHRHRDDFAPRGSAFGSARNQAERLAAWTGADRLGAGSDRMRGRRRDTPRFRDRDESGGGVPQRSQLRQPARTPAPAPRPRSRQYDRGGGTPTAQRNGFGSPSLSAPPARPSGSAGRSQRVSPVEPSEVVHGARIGAAPTLGPGNRTAFPRGYPSGEAIPAGRGFPAQPAPSAPFGANERARDWRESRTLNAPFRPTPTRTYQGPVSGASPASGVGSATDRVLRMGRSSPQPTSAPPPMPAGRQSGVRGAMSVPPAPQSAPTRGAMPSPRVQRQRGAADNEDAGDRRDQR